MAALARNGCAGGRPMRSRRAATAVAAACSAGSAAAATRRRRRSRRTRSIAASIRTAAIGRFACAPVTASSSRSAIRPMPATCPQDASICQSSCAAPAELYVYRNPGRRSIRPSRSTALPIPTFPTPSNIARSTSTAAPARRTNTIRPRSRPRTRRLKPPSARQARQEGRRRTQAAAPAARPQLNLDVTGARAETPAPAGGSPARAGGRSCRHRRLPAPAAEEPLAAAPDFHRARGARPSGRQ